MKELEFEIGERTYRIRTEVGNAVSNLNGEIGNFKLLQGMIGIYEDLNSGDKVFVTWSLIPAIRFKDLG
jgi:hypothetical protein